MQFPEIEWFTDNMFDRMIECGIAEQNGACVAAALAAEGFVPVLNNFLFASMSRAYNQIRQSILVDRFNVKFIAREGVWGEVGVSHATVEGIGSLRNLPNLVIMNPADIVEAEKATEAMMQYIGPCMVTGGAEPQPVHASSPTTTRSTSARPTRCATAKTPPSSPPATWSPRPSRPSTCSRRTAWTWACSTSAPGSPSTRKPSSPPPRAPAPSSPPRTAATSTASATRSPASSPRTCPTPLVKVGVEDEFGQSGLITPEKDELMEHFALSAADLAVSVKECIKKKEPRLREVDESAGHRRQRPVRQEVRPGPACRPRGGSRWSPSTRRRRTRCSMKRIEPYARQVQVRAGRHLRPAAALAAASDNKVDRMVNWAMILSKDPMPWLNMKIGMQGMANVFETARLLGIKRVVYASSETVYGEQEDYGDREIVEDDRLLPFPGSVYALCKCLAEVFAAQYDELYGIKSTALRPCIGYGHGGKDPVFVRWFSNIVSLPAVGKPVHLECTGNWQFSTILSDEVGEFTRLALHAASSPHSGLQPGRPAGDPADFAAVGQEVHPRCGHHLRRPSPRIASCRGR